MSETILSAGIDIGTTTTQLVFSRLTLRQTGGFGTAPKMEVQRREVFYQSKIHLTPLMADGSIDAKRVAHLIKQEYETAGMSPSDLSTGAVIITGESARKRNAKEVTMAIAELAGDFVVAAAGPDLESILAGKGAGADQLSMQKNKTVLNIDIGGGTSNYCLFDSGEVKDCACLDIGGRMLQFDEHHRVCQMTWKMAAFLQSRGFSFQRGDTLKPDEIWRIANLLAEVLAMGANLLPFDAEGRALITNHPLASAEAPKIICFSGGIAECMRHKNWEPGQFGDIGVFLGRAILANPLWQSVTIMEARETERATVIGAGNCSMELSGSTVFAQQVRFPLKNFSVHRLHCLTSEDIPTLQDQLEHVLMRDEENTAKGYALSMEGPSCPGFQDIETMAAVLSSFLRKNQDVVPVIVEHDFAKALGQSLKRHLPSGFPILCLDTVACQNGDFIDIGKPVGAGIAYPVIVKTLVFSVGEDRSL